VREIRHQLRKITPRSPPARKFFENLLNIPSPTGGMAAALVTDTVTFLRTKLAALALLAAVSTATAAPAFAPRAHAMCAAKSHGCGRAAALATCCCAARRQPLAPSGPAESLIQLVVDAAPAVAPTPAILALPSPTRIDHVRMAPPGAAPLDRLALFSTLLI
jgi:hypothetical protein